MPNPERRPAAAAMLLSHQRRKLASQVDHGAVLMAVQKRVYLASLLRRTMRGPLSANCRHPRLPQRTEKNESRCFLPVQQSASIRTFGNEFLWSRSTQLPSDRPRSTSAFRARLRAARGREVCSQLGKLMMYPHPSAAYPSIPESRSDGGASSVPCE